MGSTRIIIWGFLWYSWWWSWAGAWCQPCSRGIRIPYFLVIITDSFYFFLFQMYIHDIIGYPCVTVLVVVVGWGTYKILGNTCLGEINGCWTDPLCHWLQGCTWNIPTGHIQISYYLFSMICYVNSTIVWCGMELFDDLSFDISNGNIFMVISNHLACHLNFLSCTVFLSHLIF